VQYLFLIDFYCISLSGLLCVVAVTGFVFSVVLGIELLREGCSLRPPHEIGRNTLVNISTNQNIETRNMKKQGKMIPLETPYSLVTK
jgi:hypothetical protein